MKSRNSMSALHWAVSDGDLAAVQRAITQGGDINGVDRDGRTPLFQSVVGGNVAIVSQLLKAGAEANARDRNLETPLHFATREHQIEVAGLLLKSGAQVDAQDSYGNTPLSNAVFYSRGRGEMIKLLLAHSADKSLKNNYGVSPEELAKTIANYDVAQFFQSAKS
jgi:ankyrin repeat protein